MRDFTLWTGRCEHGHVVAAMAAGMTKNSDDDTKGLGEFLIAGYRVECLGKNADPAKYPVSGCEKCRRGEPATPDPFLTAADGLREAVANATTVLRHVERTGRVAQGGEQTGNLEDVENAMSRMRSALTNFDAARGATNE